MSSKSIVKAVVGQKQKRPNEEVGDSRSTLLATMSIKFFAFLRFVDSLAVVAVIGSSLLLAQSDLHAPHVLGLAHVAFRITDFRGTEAFYVNSLGYGGPLTFDDEKGQLGIALVKVNDQQYIEFLQGDTGNRGQLDHFALYTDDLSALRQYLSALRVPIFRDIHQGRVGNPFLAVRDPDGHLLEIIQYSSNSSTGRSKGKLMPASRASTRITHFGLLVRSEGTALKFYRDVLGFREFARGGGENGQPRWIDLHVADGTDYIELIPFADLPSPAVMKAQNHIGLEVSDTQEALSTLQRRPTNGAQSIPTTVITGGNLPPRANIFDPDGARIELMQPMPAKATPMTASHQ